jgi:hypothetical protein
VKQTDWVSITGFDVILDKTISPIPAEAARLGLVAIKKSAAIAEAAAAVGLVDYLW